MLYANEPLINDLTAGHHLNPVVGGQQTMRGLTPRPPGVQYAGERVPRVAGVDMPTIPQTEWSERIRDKVQPGRQLSNYRLRGNKGQKIPSRDQNGRGYCFPAGTRIRMADGTHKPIERVQLLEEVLSAEGNVRRVMQCHVRNYVGKMATVRMWGHRHLSLTPNHSVLTKRGYVPANELKKGDWVAIPRYAPTRNSVVQTAQHLDGVRRRIKNLAGAAQWETRLPDESDTVVNRVPDFIELNADTGRIFGLYLAEGSARSVRELVWSFGAHEKDTLAAELVNLLDRCWGVKAAVRQLPHNVTEVRVRGVLWVQLFLSLCGHRAAGKRLHADLAGGPTEFLAAVLRGWLDGDGCVKGGMQTGASVSHDLILNMYDIANGLGLKPAVGVAKGQVNEYAAHRQPVWSIQYATRQSDGDYRVTISDRHTWRRVRCVSLTAYTGKVFNIGVEEDNSYVAECVGVHNCWMHSGTSAMLAVRARDNMTYVDLSAYACACIIKNYADEGGWGAQGLDFLMSRGVPSSAFWPQQAVSSQYDKPATWENAALHKFTEGWFDLAAPQWSRQMTFTQVGTCLLLDDPVIGDFNWWAHSVCLLDLVDGVAQFGITRHPDTGKLLDMAMHELFWGLNDPVTAGFGVRIWNSWGDGWGSDGMGVLTGQKAVPDGATSPRVTTPSAA